MLGLGWKARYFFREAVGYRFPVNPQFLPGNSSLDGKSIVWATVWIENDVHWSRYTPGDSLELKLWVKDENEEETEFSIGQVFLYGTEHDGSPVDLSPPDSISDVVVNNGKPIELPESAYEPLFVPVRLRATDLGDGVSSIHLFYRNKERGETLIFSLARWI